MAKAKAEHRGSWFAIVDGERLPCVHQGRRTGMTYADPTLLRGDAKRDELIEAIETGKRVILTKGTLTENSDGSPASVTRTGYIAVYSVTDFMSDDSGTRFRFAEPRVDLD